MKFPHFLFLAMLAFPLTVAAGVSIDQEALGTSLGGWTKRGKKAAEYPLSGSTYRTYKPEVTPTPDGGLFASLRIDHVRGWLSSDDHAVLEVTISAAGNIESAQSTIAIQGRSITTDLIRSGNEAGKQLTGVDRAVQIGTDLVADLTAKMLQEKIVEPGRVSYPAVLRHNYNLLFQAIRTDPAPAPPVSPPPAPPGDPAPAPPPTAPADPAKPAAEPPRTAAKLEIKAPGGGSKAEIPAKSPQPKP
jgi:hypothetical protein